MSAQLGDEGRDALECCAQYGNETHGIERIGWKVLQVAAQAEGVGLFAHSSDAEGDVLL
jgi:hypothetical protein